MFLSLTDLFKVGIGPSSSHTMGPMVAARRFLGELAEGDWPRAAGARPERIEARLHGSLAFTGRGHASDRAVMMGLLGFEPATVDIDEAERALAGLRAQRSLPGPDGRIAFDPEADLVFDYDTALPLHPNGMTFRAFDGAGRMILRRAYYSVGGGFVRAEQEMGVEPREGPSVPFPFEDAASLLAMAERAGLSIAAVARLNEEAAGTRVDAAIDAIVGAMDGCIDRGLATDGTLPGGLMVRRRAPALHRALVEEARSNAPSPTHANDWLTVFALAVNEENAGGGRVVTAPTNGAAGVVPAVLRYAREFMPGVGAAQAREFVLTAAAIGSLIKRNASISGAEVGCQGEVGSASAMAAAGMAALMGGTPAQVENAAEIALEHHLGMTCDPVAGLVQVPCIERNAFGAIKAHAAAALALRGDGRHVVPLDACIESMRQTGRDMDERYRETSRGGLAVNVAVNHAAC